MNLLYLSIIIIIILKLILDLSSVNPETIGYLKGQKIRKCKYNTFSNLDSNRLNDISINIVSNNSSKEFRRVLNVLDKDYYDLIKNEMYLCYALFQNDIIGSLILFKWQPISNTKFYVVNDLHIDYKYRKRGIANKLIKTIGYKLLEKGYFGIFHTSYKMPLKKLFTVTWYKFELKNIRDNVIDEVNKNIEKIDKFNKNLYIQKIDKLNFFLPNHEWLKPNYIELYQFLQSSIENNLVIYKNMKYVLGTEIVIDKNKDKVLNVKWIWFQDKRDINDYPENIFNFMNIISLQNNVNYYALPFSMKFEKLLKSLKSLNNSESWDSENCYIYESEKSDIVIPILDDSDVLGWFLSR